MVLLIFLISFLVGFGTWINLFGSYHLKNDNKLSPNDWHFKFLKWLVSPFSEVYHREFKSLCSYSWVLFGIFTISPILIVIKVVVYIMVFFVWLFSKIMNPITDFCNAQADKWVDNLLKQAKEGRIPDKNALIYAEIIERAEKLGVTCSHYIRNHSRNYERDIKFIKLFEGESPILSQAELKANLLKKREEFLAKEAENKILMEKQAERNKAFLAKTETIGKWIVGVIATVLISVGLYWLFIGTKSLVLYLINDIDWVYTLQRWGEFGIEFLQILLLLVILAASSFGIGALIKFLWCIVFKYCIPCELRREKLLHYLSYLLILAYPFVWVWKGIVFIWKTLKAYKSDNCPMIVWEDNN